MSDKLVTVATFSTLTEETIAKNKLEDAGLNIFLADSTTVQVAWHLSAAVGGIKLQVMDVDADRAVSLLGSADTVPISDGQSSSCQTSDYFKPEFGDNYEDVYVSPIDKIVKRAFLCAVLGLVWLPLQFYSLWLLTRIAFDPAPLSSANRRRILITILIDSLVIIVIGALVLTMLSR